MSSAPKFDSFPAREEARLRELYRYKILNTPEDPVFDDLARLATQVCETPMAVISFMDRDRQWFKSRVGLAASDYPRQNTFCAQAIREDDLFIVPNPAKDERFAQSCAVIGDEQARFYAGAPLRVPSGHVLGTLSVLDRRPRSLNPSQRESLRALARQVVAQLEWRRSIGELEREAEERARAQAALRESEQRFQEFMNNSPALAFIKDDYGRYLYVNRRVAEQFRKPISEWIGQTDTDLLPTKFARNIQENDLSVFNDGQTRVVEEGVAPTPDGGNMHWLSYKFLLRDGDGAKRLGGFSIDITERKKAEQERERLVCELQDALAQVKTLKGFIPICASCKNIRDDEGYWQQIESYLCEHADVEFTHGICPECLEKLYPEFAAHRAARAPDAP